MVTQIFPIRIHNDAGHSETGNVKHGDDLREHRVSATPFNLSLVEDHILRTFPRNPRVTQARRRSTELESMEIFGIRGENTRFTNASNTPAPPNNYRYISNAETLSNTDFGLNI